MSVGRTPLIRFPLRRTPDGKREFHHHGNDIIIDQSVTRRGCHDLQHHGDYAME